MISDSLETASKGGQEAEETNRAREESP